jgi:hypothetical protein
MDEIRTLAHRNVGRMVGFAWAGIALLVLLASFDPLLALRAGGTLALALSVHLILRAARVSHDDVQRAALLAVVPTAGFARRADARNRVGQAIMEAHLIFARAAAGSAVAFLAGSILVSAFR